MAESLTIGEVCKLLKEDFAGVSISKIRYLEDQKLLSPRRTAGGYRLYSPLDVERLRTILRLQRDEFLPLRVVLRRIAFIVFAQRVGLTLGEIGAELAKLPADHAPTRGEWSRLSRTWTSRIDERIAELERLKLGLTECIGCGCLSLDRCQLSNPGDRAASLGAGPRYWIGDRPVAR